MNPTSLLWHPFAGGLLLAVHLVIWVVLAAYGLHRLHLILLYRKNEEPPPLPSDPEAWPIVTVQLPVYNERYVVERLLGAAAALDYPREKLEIQLLDDSTDETVAIAARAIEEIRSRGIDAVHLHRGSREGYKAGALRYGLERARGSLLAVFDADFVPPPRFLRETIPYFGDAGVGMVQARWLHLNPDQSLLSRVQAISLDAHFLIEHSARQNGGRYFNFNGTAGVLRKSCVIASGGWQSDTLTEDLDLSYRAQLMGWRFVFASQVGCPAELPAEMNAFKAQQHRWVRGSIQVARKLLPRIWFSSGPFRVKLEATFHLTSNVPYVLLLLLALIVFPVTLARYESKSLPFLIADTALLLAATVPILFYFGYAQRKARADWRAQLRYVPLVFMLGIGLAVNNARAVLEGALLRAGTFHRTPKLRIEGRAARLRAPGPRSHRAAYRARVSVASVLEVGLACYFIWAMASLAEARLYAPLPFFALYLGGFLYVGTLSFAHAIRRS
jgi:cellulose synthase/poly-beta-1,6-N-acetylglucosamine synthase-like glycosyltransferase